MTKFDIIQTIVNTIEEHKHNAGFCMTTTSDMVVITIMTDNGRCTSEVILVGNVESEHDVKLIVTNMIDRVFKED